MLCAREELTFEYFYKAMSNFFIFPSIHTVSVNVCINKKYFFSSRFFLITFPLMFLGRATFGISVRLIKFCKVVTQGPFSNTNHLSEILRGFVIFSAKNKTTKAMINISVITI
jgi:hypothetical protein